MNSFTYMFKDKDLWLKGLMIVLIMAVGPAVMISSTIFTNIIFAVIGGIIWLISFLILMGYMIACIQADIKNKENPILPYIEFNHIKKGCIWTVAQFLYSLLSGVVGFLIGILMAIPFVNILAFILYFAFVIFILTINPALMYILAKKESVLSMVQWKKAVGLIVENPSKYIQACLKFILVFIIDAVVLSPFIVILSLTALSNPKAVVSTLVGSVIFSIATIAVAIYSFFVNAHIIATCSDMEI